MKMIVLENVRERLERHPDPDECWLYCDVCRRFFQYKSAVPSFLLERDACPFDDCYGYGIGFNILMWDDLREPEDPRWPRSTAELEHGMQAPAMAPFYAAQLQRRIHRLLADFAQSSELAEVLGREAAPCYLGPFLQMMSDLSWNLTDTDDDYFDEEIARMVLADLPVWSQTAELAPSSARPCCTTSGFGGANRPERSAADAGESEPDREEARRVWPATNGANARARIRM